MTPLSSLSAEAAARDPDGLALVFDGREISFADLHRRVEGVAGELRSHGVSAGTPVGVGTVNTAEAVATLLAVWRLGAIVIDLAPGLSGTDRRSAVERTGAPVLWSSEGLTETGVHAQGPALELACVTFTSGSTGIPKGVMLGEDNLVRNAELYVRHFRLTPADRTCLVLPLSFGMNKIALLAHLSIGAGVLLEPDFMVPNRALGAMHAHGGTGFCLVPTALTHLLARGDREGYRLDAVRYVRVGAGRMHPEQAREVQGWFPGADVFLTYGLTEVGLVASMTAHELAARPDACGRVVPEVDVHTDAAGEIIVAAGHAARGYWGDDEATAEVFRADGVHTGDLGRVDGEGYLVLTGRAKDLIKSGGESIQPAEVEAALLAHPDVEDCAVVGVPDGWLGERVEAVVVPRPGARLDEATLRAHATRMLPAIKRPAHYRFSDDLSRTATGKLRRGELVPTDDQHMPVGEHAEGRR